MEAGRMFGLGPGRILYIFKPTHTGGEGQEKTTRVRAGTVISEGNTGLNLIGLGWFGLDRGVWVGVLSRMSKGQCRGNQARTHKSSAAVAPAGAAAFEGSKL
jgi:hypothetical protein